MGIHIPDGAFPGRGLENSGAGEGVGGGALVHL